MPPATRCRWPTCSAARTSPRRSRDLGARSLEQTDAGFSITRIELHTTGTVGGVDAATFGARAAGEGDLPRLARTCGTEITLVAELVANQREAS